MCRRFEECENPTDAGGDCLVHPPKRKPVRMTAKELQEHGLDIAISKNGTTVRKDKINEENEAAEEVNRGAATPG